jgi:EAL domain-containing protein (putative c-di-GMP-specific phosphodiesterase class I)
VGDARTLQFIRKKIAEMEPGGELLCFEVTEIAAIDNIGHILGLKTVAEFVETVEIRHSLRAISVDYVQDFGVQASLPILQQLGLPEPLQGV